MSILVSSVQKLYEDGKIDQFVFLDASSKGIDARALGSVAVSLNANPVALSPALVRSSFAATVISAWKASCSSSICSASKNRG